MSTVKVTETLDIKFLSKPSILTRKVYLVEIRLKLMSGHDFAYAGRTDRQTDDMRHNIIRMEVPESAYKDIFCLPTAIENFFLLNALN